MSEQVTTEPTATAQDVLEQQPASQEDYAQDAFSEYMADPKADTEEEQQQSEEDKAKTPKEPTTEETPKNDQQNGKKPEENAKPNPFESAFTNESGDFDLDKLVGVSLDGLSLKGVEEKAVKSTPANGDEKPEWQREYEAEKTFRENMNNARLGPLSEVFDQIKGSDVPDEYKGPILDLFRQVYSRIEAENNAYFKERDAQADYRKRQSMQDKIAEEARESKLPEIAKANASAIINKLSGKDTKEKVDLYNFIMFSPDAGGELLEDMFVARYPDFAKLPKEELGRLKRRFVNELQADGTRLKRHFDRAYRYLTASPGNMKKILSQVSRSTEANVRSNALAAQRSPGGEVQRQPQAANSKWDGYFADPAGLKTRI